MGLILSKDTVDHVLDSGFAEGMVRGATGAVMLVVGLALTSEPVMGIIVGLLMGLCFSDFAVEKFHVSQYKPKRVCVGVLLGLLAGGLAAYLATISFGYSFTI